MRRSRHAGFFNKGLFDVSILRSRNCKCVRRSSDAGIRKTLQGGGGHVFKFRCHRTNVLGERINAFGIVIGGFDLQTGYFAGGRICARLQNCDVIAHGGSGLRKHAAELAAAQ